MVAVDLHAKVHRSKIIRAAADLHAGVRSDREVSRSRRQCVAPSVPSRGRGWDTGKWLAHPTWYGVTPGRKRGCAKHRVLAVSLEKVQHVRCQQIDSNHPERFVWKILYYFIMFIIPVLFFVPLNFHANFLSSHKIV
jgi:hypothetical protein